MKLTKDQRFTAYCILLVEAKLMKGDEGEGFCGLVADTTGQWPSCIDGELTIWFPELEKYKPVDIGPYNCWFNTDKRGWSKRISILEQCIAETATP